MVDGAICGIHAVDWVVRHHAGEVILSDPLLVDDQKVKRFDLSARIPVGIYRREIVAFAVEARRFYFSEGPRHVPGLEPHLYHSERELYERFWAEFDERFARARRAELID